MRLWSLYCSRGGAGVLRKLRTKRLVFFLVIFAGFLFVNVLLEMTEVETAEESPGGGARLSEFPHLAPNSFFTRVSFVMSDAMAAAWRSSKGPVEFLTELRVERVAFRAIHRDDERLFSDLQASNVTARFHDANSFKPKHTTRRSLYIRSDDFFRFVSPSTASSLADGENNTSVFLKEFLLLSLCEDTHRIGYRSSVDLLRQFDLFLAYAQLVELRCYPSSPDPPRHHPCGPSTKGTSARDGEQQGRSLGVYLVLETPARAIFRRMEEIFSVFDAELLNASDVVSPATHPLFRRREFEEEAEHKARIACWRQMWSLTRELHMGNLEDALEVGARNYLGFREPHHDLLHVPSYKKNSSILPSYRLLENNVTTYSFYSEDDAPIKDPEEHFFDMPLYMSWLAINTILQNGNYDSDVFFYGVLQSRLKSLKQEEKGPLPEYLGTMGWNYGAIFTPCRRMLWFKTLLMYCAETTLDYRIVKRSGLRWRYLETLWEMMQRVDEKRFGRSVAVAENELRTILYGSPGALVATFGTQKRDDNDGVRWMMRSFLKRRRKLLRVLASYYPVNEVLRLDPANYMDSGGLKIHIMESFYELVKRLASMIQLKNSDLSPRWRFSFWGVQTARGVELDEASNGHYVLPARGMYCVRVSCSTSFFTNVGLLSSFNWFLEWGLPGNWLIDMPLVLANKSLGDAEYGLWSFSKPRPMGYPVTPPDDKSTLHIVMPPVWPRGSEGARGVFVARVLLPQDNASGPSFKWNRANTLLSTLGGGSTETVIVQGFSAVRFVVLPKTSENRSLFDNRYAQGNVEEGPLLFVDDQPTTELFLSGLKVFQPVPLASVAEPPSPPSTAKGLVDANGVVFGDYLKSGNTLLCDPTTAKAAVRNGTVRTAVCPIFVRSSFAVRAGAVLDVAAGCVVVMLPGATLRVSGAVRFNGTKTSPIVVTSVSTAGASSWRTIHVDGPLATLFAEFTFFTGSGVKDLRVPHTGQHHSHSAAISATNEARVSLHHSFLLELRGVGIAAGKGAKLRIVDSLVQWAQMGVECLGCDFLSQRSVWTHFPEWDTKNVHDHNDAMRLSSGNHRVIDSVVAHTGADGIVSGAEGNGGLLVVHNTVVEGCVHAGVFLSADPRSQRQAVISHTIVQYCQQGIQSGYTSTQHTASVTSSLLKNCAIGVRYGDGNLFSFTDGELMVHNSTFSDNEVNVMNYERRHNFPKNSGRFHSQARLALDHWFLLQRAASESALSPETEMTTTDVLLLADVRRRTLQLSDWAGCDDMFALPGKNVLEREGSVTDFKLPYEADYISNITVKL